MSKINFSYHTYVCKALCVVFSLYKVYEVVLLRFHSSFCVEALSLLKKSNKILSSTPLLYSFQNLIVHRVALTTPLF